ncbi:MAG TPA: sodium:proton antiporter, partial [Candidatus Sumerlaeota bacterium]|nr:sodium:proton antiporter [Candidatus Sumerlaeota bacterium]
ATGVLSSMLDNAPTYLCFLTVATGLHGLSIDEAGAVNTLLTMPLGAGDVGAISLGAVFWGAMTYIGNGPNFMVRNIAAAMGADPPDFLSYIFKYAVVYLLPVLLVVLFLL